MKEFLKDDVKLNIHSSVISSILPDRKSYMKENTMAILKTDNSIKKVGIDMKQFFNKLSNISKFCTHIGKFNPEPLVIQTNCNREVNKANEENEFVPKKINTFSDMIEYVEVTNFSKMSLNSADQMRIQRIKFIFKKYNSMIDKDNEISLMNTFERLHEKSKYKLGPFHNFCRQL